MCFCSFQTKYIAGSEQSIFPMNRPGFILHKQGMMICEKLHNAICKERHQDRSIGAEKISIRIPRVDVKMRKNNSLMRKNDVRSPSSNQTTVTTSIKDAQLCVIDQGYKWNCSKIVVEATNNKRFGKQRTLLNFELKHDEHWKGHQTDYELLIYIAEQQKDGARTDQRTEGNVKNYQDS
ncbi:hypothetical protein CAEBREN_25018 [Caenorhabditis brenneri]|uniref:Uncharacterized protein n=1 Tax=Caenorhabditis brenneri TaxID=135651 RepID=G0NGB6_CAEBE|nr:hypothetical protein CAEBREN_25018 [Caenorhabditis brenneri]